MSPNGKKCAKQIKRQEPSTLDSSDKTYIEDILMLKKYETDL